MRDVLTLQVTGRHETEFVMRFQQFTGPVMAKGVEDTAFYCYNRLAGVNEVGNDPARDGVSVDEFHAYCATMQETHPHTMTTLSTHDTKRSDDVRARLAVLSEVPSRFGAGAAPMVAAECRAARQTVATAAPSSIATPSTFFIRLRSGHGRSTPSG